MELNEKKSSKKDASKETLYVCRPVENADEIIAWAKEVGLSSTLPADDMHVTIAYSKAKVDWDEIGDPLEEEIEVKGGERSVKQFDRGAVVLRLESDQLQDRWEEFCDAGCSWDYPDYCPHVTITYDGAGDIDLDELEPYKGKIVLGKEKFQKLNPNWKSQVKEKITEVAFDDFETAAKLLLEEKIATVDFPGTFWFRDGKLLDCDDHGEYVADHYRRMKIDRAEVREIVMADGDEDINSIANEELCELAMDEGWIMGEGNSFTGSTVKALRKAAQHFHKEWPEETLVFVLNDRWRAEFTPEEVEEFAEDGLLPLGLSEAEQPTPRKFWLVFDLPLSEDRSGAEDILRGVAQGELHGIRGISDTREIITSFFSVARNAALVMDSKEVAKENTLERIQYESPKYLLANQMEALYRIWDKSPTKHGHYGLMLNVMQYTVRAAKDILPSYHFYMHYYGFESRVASVYQQRFEDGNLPRINSLADLQDFIYEATMEIANDGNKWRNHLITEFADMPKDGLDRAVAEAIRFTGRLYADEGEWLVKDAVFRVPKGSILLVTVNKEALDNYPAWLRWKEEHPDEKPYRNIEGIHPWNYERLDVLFKHIKHYRLEERYTIRLIDEFKFQKVRGDVVTRRQKRRS